MYFKKERPGNDPFFKFGKKRNVYRYFFEKGRDLGFDMYLASGPEAYRGGLSFNDPAFFNGNEFAKTQGTIIADAIYDRSGGISFPAKEMDGKVLNCSDFKILCNDKNKMYEYFGQFMPKSFELKKTDKFQEVLNGFREDELAVLKPAKGLGGKGIIIDKVSELRKTNLDPGNEYVIQDFIDTSCGIEGLSNGRHDLRVVIVNGKTVLSHIRTPREGSYLANASQGGSIKEVPLEKIPQEIMDVAEKIKTIVDEKFQKPVYSIDFGMTRNGPYVFELNDQIGFPSDDMRNHKSFIDGLLDSLTILSDK